MREIAPRRTKTDRKGVHPAYLRFCCALGLFLLLSVSGYAQEWTRFRGPNGTGLSAAATVPMQFGKADYNWRVSLPGEGHSSPVLWGRKIFVTAAEEEKGRRHLVCLRATDGKILWTRTCRFTPYARHPFNSAASSTPTVDAERVYVVWDTQDSFTVLALNHNGSEVWRRDFGAHPTQHGGAASPIVVGDILIVAKEPEDNDGILLGLDCKTGATRWQRARPNREAAPYATPILYRPPDGPVEVLFASTAHGITSLDPETGDLNWQTPRLSEQRCVGSPVFANGLVFATFGNGGGVRLATAVRPGSRKTGLAPTVEYRLTRGTSYVPTPIALGNRVFFWGDNGIVTCVKADTGEKVWMERVGGNFFGSPVCVNGRLYAMSANGELIVIEALDRFKLLARIDLGEPSHATPAVAEGVMYLRTRSHLISVGGKKQSALR